MIIAFHVGLHLGSKIDALAFAQGQSFESKDPKKNPEGELSGMNELCSLPGEPLTPQGQEQTKSVSCCLEIRHKQLLTPVELELHVFSDSADCLADPCGRGSQKASWLDVPEKLLPRVSRKTRKSASCK